MNKANISVYAFWLKRVSYSDLWISKRELFHAYETFCDEVKKIPVSNNKFSRCIIKIMGENTTYYPIDSNGKRVYAWKGIGLKK